MAAFEIVIAACLICQCYLLWLSTRRHRNQSNNTQCPKFRKQDSASLPEIKITQKQIDIKEECSICFEAFQFEESVTHLHCEHIFHKNCITEWLERSDTCPVCRKSQIDADKTHAIQSEHEGSRFTLASMSQRRSIYPAYQNAYIFYSE